MRGGCSGHHASREEGTSGHPRNSGHHAYRVKRAPAGPRSDTGGKRTRSKVSRYITFFCSTRTATITIHPENRPTTYHFTYPAVYPSKYPPYSTQTQSPTMATVLAPTASLTKAKYVQLGSSGLRISNPILGAMSFGDVSWMAWCLDESKALPILKDAYDQGINTWDTSNNYSNGMSEKIIAKAIKTYQIPRENLVIMTKCYFPVGGLYSYSDSLWRLC